MTGQPVGNVSLSPPSVRCGAATSAGHRRTVNEDSYLAGPEWFVVADGVGGHGSGDVASAVVVASLATHETPWRCRSVDDVRAAVASSNDAVLTRASVDGTAGMGTTVVGAVVIGRPQPAIAVFHVGDSRCYQLRDGRLSLLTIDHSHVQELLDAGELTVDQVATHPLRNVVTRALGIDPEVRVDVARLPVAPTRLLLCSDGLSGELTARTIGRVLAGFTDPQAAADRLVELTLAGPARDNVTALVVDLAIDDRPTLCA